VNNDNVITNKQKTLTRVTNKKCVTSIYKLAKLKLILEYIGIFWIHLNYELCWYIKIIN